MFLRNYFSARDENSSLEKAKKAAKNAPFKVYKLISSKLQKKKKLPQKTLEGETPSDLVEARRQKIDMLIKANKEKMQGKEKEEEEEEKGKEKEEEKVKPDKMANISQPNGHPSEKETAEEDDDTWCFYVLGCQGNAKATQQKVAALMDEIAKNPQRRKPRFILLLGDNFYDWGVSSPEDPMFKSHFQEIYSACGIPCFVILGNHDENLHTASFPGQEKGVPRGFHQVVHSYLGDEKFTTTEKINLYTNGIIDAEKNACGDEEESCSDSQPQQTVLDTDNLPNWNMPSRAYALECENTVIFCIDSNTYVQEYLAYINRKKLEPEAQGSENESINRENDLEKNQAFWLAKNVNAAKAAGKKVILALHHPPRTPCKRVYKSDLKIYLEKELPQVKEHFSGLWEAAAGTAKKIPYNDLIYATLKEQGLIFDGVLSAHDHAMYNIIEDDDDYPLYQFTSGGGGGKLQDQVYFKNIKRMRYYLREHGYTEVICSETNIRYVVRTLDGHHLEFDYNQFDRTLQHIRTYPEGCRQDEVMKMEKFCGAVKAGLDLFFEYCDKKQMKYQGHYFNKRLPPENTLEGVDRAQKVWAYISHKEADDYKTTLKKVFDLVTWDAELKTPSKHSLWHYIDAELAKTYGESESLAGMLNMTLVEPEPNLKHVSNTNEREFGM